MHKQSMRFSFLALLLAVAMVVVSIQVAAAAEGDEWEITGTVISIDEENNSFVVETEEGETYTVLTSEELDFDFKTLKEGDIVEVEVTENEDGSLSATKVKIEEQEDDSDPHGGYYCEQSDERHPFGERLANGYEIDYETLQKWFCDGFGWGQIMLALKTSEITDDDFDALLERRGEGEGWGQIWQDLELIGRPEDAGPLNDEDGNGRPDFAGPPEWVGDGRPEEAGPPEWVGDGRPEEAGPPEWVGDGHSEDVDLPGDEERNGRPENAGPAALPQVPGGPSQGVRGGRP